MNANELDRGNHYIFDPESPAELVRLLELDRLTTRAMGGALAGLPALPQDAQVLDLACGPGGWVLDVAFALKEAQVAGIDLSQRMVSYAYASAFSQQLGNATFGVMDITQPLDFSDASFDLVNARFLVGVLKREQWQPLLEQCVRLLRPGGILRLSEPLDGGGSSDAASQELSRWLCAALHRAGYGWSADGSGFGLGPVLPWLLRQAGLQQVRTAAHVIECSQGTPAWKAMADQTDVALAQATPLLLKTGVTTEQDLRAVQAQMLWQRRQPDWCGLWLLLSAWGRKPSERLSQPVDESAAGQPRANETDEAIMRAAPSAEAAQEKGDDESR